jgi:hypothetical protein
MHLKNSDVSQNIFYLTRMHCQAQRTMKEFLNSCEKRETRNEFFHTNAHALPCTTNNERYLTTEDTESTEKKIFSFFRVISCVSWSLSY